MMHLRPRCQGVTSFRRYTFWQIVPETIGRDQDNVGLFLLFGAVLSVGDYFLGDICKLAEGVYATGKQQEQG